MEQKISKQTIFTSIVLWLCVVLAAMLVLNNSKVKAAQDILEAKERISELNAIIDDAKERYQIAIDSDLECHYSWMEEAEKAHQTAEKARAEKDELVGFLMSREAR